MTRIRTTASSLLLLLAGSSLLFFPQNFISADSPEGSVPDKELLQRVIANQKKEDADDRIYERVERKQTYKNDGTTLAETKTTRVIPVGTGFAHLTVGPDGEPADPVTYRQDLEETERRLLWNTQDDHAQRAAYEKVEKKQKLRNELMDAVLRAFLFTFQGRETREGRTIVKYHFEPNPAYKPISRATAIFSKVHGDAWLDETPAQITRVEGQVTDDISIAGILAKVYRGSQFMEERHEVQPGVWMPTYAQYDFDGRKLFVGFAIHEHTYDSHYRRIGPPQEALEAVRAELTKPATPANAATTTTCCALRP